MELSLLCCILIVLLYGLKASTLKLTRLCLATIFFASITGILAESSLSYWLWIINIFILISGLTVLLMLEGWTSHRSSPLLVLLIILSSLLIIRSTNLMFVYLTLEMQTLCIFILVSYNKNSLLSAEAGLKYFVLGALSSGLFLFGCALIYSSTGELEFQFICTSIVAYKTLAGKCFITVSLLFKVAAAPFHLWNPDIYNGAPTWVSALLSIIPKLGILTIMLQIGLNERGLLLAGLISLIIGAIGALNQTRIKRLLAYSGIGHMGFILLGISISSMESIQASIIYLSNYILAQILLWTIILIISPKREMIVEFSGTSKLNWTLAIALATGLLSTAGVPPLIGFLVKWHIILAAIGQGYYLSALIALACSVVAGAYYLRLIKIIFYQSSSTPLLIETVLNPPHEMSLGRALLIGISLYLTLTIIFCPSLFFQLAHLVALALFLCIS